MTQLIGRSKSTLLPGGGVSLKQLRGRFDIESNKYSNSADQRKEVEL